MRKNLNNILIILVLTFFAVEGFAQMHISTNLRQDGVYNETTEKFDVFNEDEDELTFFEFNKEFTMFKHTTPTITSAYLIKSFEEDEINKVWEGDIVSDVGNHYYLILDLKNEYISFVYESDGTTYAVIHRIKRMWFD